MVGDYSMTWYTGDPSHEPIFQEIDEQTDRGVVLISVALLDKLLMDAIKTRLFIMEEPDKNLMGRLFKGAGKLADFSARIDLGFLMQMYSSDAHELLHELREIRNDFAHDPSPLDFNQQKISA